MSESNQKSLIKRRRFRFSIAFLLFLMTCVSGYFFGYQSGYNSGAKYEATISSKVYYVEDLIKAADAPADWSAKKKDFDKLIELITSTVSKKEWDNGISKIIPFPQQVSLVVNCTGKTHNQVAELLQQLRDIAFKLPENFVERARTVAHRGKLSRQVIKAIRTISREGHTRMVNHFHSAVGDLSNEFGPPALNAAAEDAVFPEWIGAQKVALWNYGSGKLYLGLVDCRPEGEALVVGWWEPKVGRLDSIDLEWSMLPQDE